MQPNIRRKHYGIFSPTLSLSLHDKSCNLPCIYFPASLGSCLNATSQEAHARAINAPISFAILRWTNSFITSLSETTRSMVSKRHSGRVEPSRSVLVGVKILRSSGTCYFAFNLRSTAGAIYCRKMLSHTHTPLSLSLSLSLSRTRTHTHID